jgi:hypothetical protein
MGWHITRQHSLIDKRWHSSIPDVWSTRGADCDTGHYLVDTEVRERSSEGKQAMQVWYGVIWSQERSDILQLSDNYKKSTIGQSISYYDLRKAYD